MSLKTIFDGGSIDSDRVKLLLSLGLTRGNASSETEPREVFDVSESAMEQLAADLQQVVLSDDSGPISFARLTGIAPTECAELRGRTFLEALVSPGTNTKSLQAIIDYGEMLDNACFPGSTRAAGSVIRSLGLITLTRRAGRSLPEAEVSAVMSVLSALSSSRFLPKEIREHADTSQSRISAGELS